MTWFKVADKHLTFIPQSAKAKIQTCSADMTLKKKSINYNRIYSTEYILCWQPSGFEIISLGICFFYKYLLSIQSLLFLVNIHIAYCFSCQTFKLRFFLFFWWGMRGLNPFGQNLVVNIINIMGDIVMLRVCVMTQPLPHQK